MMLERLLLSSLPFSTSVSFSFLSLLLRSIVAGWVGCWLGDACVRVWAGLLALSSGGSGGKWEWGDGSRRRFVPPPPWLQEFSHA